MFWTVVGSGILLYWVLLFVRMRVTGRHDFDRAFEEVAAHHAPGESFEVAVPMTIKPVRVAAIVLGPPLVLILLGFFARHSPG